MEDQNVVIEGGKIAAIEKGADVPVSTGATVQDLRGYSVMPGIVGMHNHLYYQRRPNLKSDDVEHADKVEIHAVLTSTGLQNSVLKQIVSRLSLEPSVSGVSWEILAEQE